jgi:hypothetical protein
VYRTSLDKSDHLCDTAYFGGIEINMCRDAWRTQVELLTRNERERLPW